jgi:hypothetical protein
MAPPATAPELVNQIGMALAAGGLQPAWTNQAGFRTVIGGSSTFKWRWFATRLNWLVYAAEMPGDVPVAALDTFLDQACQDSINRKGLMRGAQSGVAAVSVAAVKGASPDAVHWADHPHGRRFAAITFPVLADVATGRVTRPERMLLGGLYAGFLKDLVAQYVETPLRG